MSKALELKASGFRGLGLRLRKGLGLRTKDNIGNFIFLIGFSVVPVWGSI